MEVNKKGLTIIEIIITIAILGMVAIMFVQIFTVSFQHIMTAGEDSKELIENQMDLEAIIDSDGPGVELELDIHDLFPTLYGENVKSIEGVVVNQGAFQSYLPGVKDYIVYVTNLVISETTITLTGINEVYNIIPVITPSDSTNMDVEWTSSNPSAVTVFNGLITAVSSGSSTITAKALGSDPLDFVVDDTVIVNVTLPVGSDADLTDIRTGTGANEKTVPDFNPATVSYTITVTSSNDPKIKFTLSDSNATAVLDPTDMKNGDNTATITVTSADGNTTKVYTLTFVN